MSEPGDADTGPVDPVGRCGVDSARALTVALEAAQIAIEVLHSTARGTIATKRDAADVVTDIDTATERAVREHVAGAFPGHAFVGEEFGGRDDGGPTWFCDPVDGTMNLASGLPWTSFSLSLAVGRRPLVGVVADPWRRDVWHAVTGRGAFCGDEPLAVSDRSALAGAVVMTEWANHRPWPGMASLLGGLAEAMCTARVMGSGTLAVACVGVGRAAGAVIGRFAPEDHLAAALICREAGAVVTDRHGTETTWPDGPLVVAAPGVHEQLQGLVEHSQR